MTTTNTLALAALALLLWAYVTDRPTTDLAPLSAPVVVHVHPAPLLSLAPTDPDSELDPESCALLALARIAAVDGARLGAGHWRLASVIGDVAETCDRARQLVAIARQESAWTSGAVSHAGACGITQVRSCDAEGTVPDLPCCDGYERRGYHCRPTCEWLLDTRNAVEWTDAWMNDFGWSPRRYVGSSTEAVWRPYQERADWLLALTRGAGE